MPGRPTGLQISIDRRTLEQSIRRVASLGGKARRRMCNPLRSGFQPGLGPRLRDAGEDLGVGADLFVQRTDQPARRYAELLGQGRPALLVLAQGAGSVAGKVAE